MVRVSLAALQGGAAPVAPSGKAGEGKGADSGDEYEDEYAEDQGAGMWALCDL